MIGDQVLNLEGIPERNLMEFAAEFLCSQPTFLARYDIPSYDLRSHVDSHEEGAHG
ncbi:hypothetical protein MD484_g8138, partial [Candolleomyces efflorescens]